MNLVTSLAAPWKKFDYPQLSLGWRMGEGEQYMREWRKWFKSLDTPIQQDYIEQNPLPQGWFIFYELLMCKTSVEKRELRERYSIE